VAPFHELTKRFAFASAIAGVYGLSNILNVRHDRDEKNPRLRIKREETLDSSDEIELMG
jgi:hypothetical protein